MLLKTQDNLIIDLLLKIQCKLLIQEDASYKLVMIKKGQVNTHQQTTLRLVDFISVMVTNKRPNQDPEASVLFTHDNIVTFCKRHEGFFEVDQAIKVFILSRKFRLALQYLTSKELPVEFEMDFFRFAIEANAYDIVFFLLQRYED